MRRKHTQASRASLPADVGSFQDEARVGGGIVASGGDSVKLKMKCSEDARN
jgi:hypothetical protein